MHKTTINDLLGDFNLAADKEKGLTNGRTVTIWVSPDVKARYDRLQEKSGRQFSKKAREVLITLIEAAEARTA